MKIIHRTVSTVSPVPSLKPIVCSDLHLISVCASHTPVLTSCPAGVATLDTTGLHDIALGERWTRSPLILVWVDPETRTSFLKWFQHNDPLGSPKP